jgi:hypothetical protein
MDGDELRQWQDLLDEAERRFTAREIDHQGVAWTASDLIAFALERDILAEQRDDLASAFDERADRRDRAAETRDVNATARARDHGLDAPKEGWGFADRLLAAEDRDEAAGDRADARDDRKRSSKDRGRATEDRHRTAPDLSAAMAVGERAELALENLTQALAERATVGQATGLLMGRHNLTSERAGAMLSALAHEKNLRRAVVAKRLIAAASSHRAETAADA